LEASPKTARLWRAVFGLQSGEFAPVRRELSALKLILRIAVTFSSAGPASHSSVWLLRPAVGLLLRLNHYGGTGSNRKSAHGIYALLINFQEDELNIPQRLKVKNIAALKKSLL